MDSMFVLGLGTGDLCLPRLITMFLIMSTGVQETASDCPGHLDCIPKQACSHSKYLNMKLDEATAARDYAKLADYAAELRDIPKCGNDNFCCQQQGTINHN